jgi:hypothetical protein
VIYRILSDRGEFVVDPARTEDSDDAWVWQPTRTEQGGVDRASVDWRDLPSPDLTNPRARFYFTEEGWQRYGRHVYQSALDAGHQLTVIRRKNPDPSQVVYRDRWQVAILPRKPRRHEVA